MSNTVKFLQGSVHHTDLYLDELKANLMWACGVLVDESTIYKAPKQSGFTMKKVYSATISIHRHSRILKSRPQ